MAKRGQGDGTISKRPDGTWWARITLGKDENGKQKRKAFYGKTQDEVQEKLAAALNDANNETYTEPIKMTLAQWNEIWIKEYKENSVRHGTIFEIRQKVRNHINPELGHYKLKDLQRSMIQTFINKLEQDGYPIRTIRRDYRILYNSLTKACDNGIIVKHPAAGIKLPQRQKRDKLVLTKEEEEAFIECAKRSNTGKLLIFIIAMGLSRGEATALTWNDVDFEQEVVYINKTLALRVIDKDDYSQGRKFEIMPLNAATGNRALHLLPRMASLLKELYAEKEMRKTGYEDIYRSELIFCPEMENRARYYSADYRFDKTLRDIGIPKTKALSVSALKQTFANCGIESNQSIREGDVNG